MVLYNRSRRGRLRPCREQTQTQGGTPMKLNQFITAFTLIVLLALLICIVYARATWEGVELPSQAPTVAAEETVKPEP